MTDGTAYTHVMTATLAARFAAKLDTSAGPDACHPWRGFVDANGYGRLRYGGRDTPVGYAHRIAYELAVGPIPDGLAIDHLCRRRDCVNATHLETVPMGINTSRGESPNARTVRLDRCKRGHPFTANAYTHSKTGKRQCRACAKARRAASK